MNKLRPEAEKLRDQGYSYPMIAKELGIARSTLSNWFKDRPFIPNKEAVERIKYGPIKSGARRHNIKVENIVRLKELGIQEIGDLSRRDLWMLGLGIYIGEGAKSTESVGIANSDPAVIAISIRWLKEICGLTAENFAIRLHLYPDNNLQESHLFWRRVTRLPESCFRTPYIDTRQNKRTSNRRKLPYGTADLRAIANGDSSKGAALFRRINGWMIGALKEV